MTQEDKNLLIKDLCARLPYEVMIHTIWNEEVNGRILRKEIDRPLDFHDLDDYWNCKPYLRPMSSMTEEEKEELRILKWTKLEHYTVDWLNAHHLDYRELIKKGIALEAPEGMYNINE